jgi:hypothetical protein
MPVSAAPHRTVSDDRGAESGEDVEEGAARPSGGIVSHWSVAAGIVLLAWVAASPQTGQTTSVLAAAELSSRECCHR